MSVRLCLLVVAAYSPIPCWRTVSTPREATVVEGSSSLSTAALQTNHDRPAELIFPRELTRRREPSRRNARALASGLIHAAGSAGHLAATRETPVQREGGAPRQMVVEHKTNRLKFDQRPRDAETAQTARSAHTGARSCRAQRPNRGSRADGSRAARQPREHQQINHGQVPHLQRDRRRQELAGLQRKAEEDRHLRRRQARRQGPDVKVGVQRGARRR